MDQHLPDVLTSEQARAHFEDARRLTAEHRPHAAAAALRLANTTEAAHRASHARAAAS